VSFVAELALGPWLLVRGVSVIDGEMGLPLEEWPADAPAAGARP
jgi:hypothetical protein